MVEIVNMKTCTDWGKPGDVRIDRGTRWGNPFRMFVESDRGIVCDQYALYMMKLLQIGERNIEELLDAKRLGCWCAPKRCHGDFLKRLIEDELRKRNGKK